MNWLLNSNVPSARVLRTIVSGVLSVIPGIVNYYLSYMPEWVAVAIVPIMMCIFSPIMAELGKKIADDSTVASTD